MGKQAPVSGNQVLFVGGPEAGNVRLIPESYGELVKSEGDYIYRIHPFGHAAKKQVAYFAFAEGENPLNLLIMMWREYSPVAQIKRGTDLVPTYQKLK